MAQMKYRLTLTQRAQTNLDEIIHHVAVYLENPESAQKIAREVLRKCNLVTIFPKGNAVKYKIGELEFRSIRAKKYQIYYIVDDERRTVEVRTIIYARRDINDQSFTLPSSAS